MPISIVLPEPDDRVGNGFVDLTGPALLKALHLPPTLSVLGVRWSVPLQSFRVVVRGVEIPACGGAIVSVDPIHTEKELRDAKVAAGHD